MSSEIVGKTLSLIELDLDVYRATQFEAETLGIISPHWSLNWNTTDTVLTVAAQSSLPSGRGLRMEKTSVTGQHTFMPWDLIPSITNVSIVALVRSVVTPTVRMGIAARSTVSPSLAAGYTLEMQDSANIAMNKIDAGVPTSLGVVGFAFGPNENLWMRFDALNVAGGVLVRGKVWRGLIGDEPQTFIISATDTVTPYTGAGHIGLVMGGVISDNYCGYFRARSYYGALTETLRYAKPTSYLPIEFDAIPNIKDISHTPATISLGENLGTRAQIQVRAIDHQSADLGEFYDQGTYWGKFRARNIFRRGQPFRLKNGLLGQAIGDFATNHFVLDSFDGPTPNDEFTLLGQDILKLADSDRAQCPALSNGKLSADLTAVATSATLIPAGVGEEYPSTGYANIGGEEVVSYTRVGDVLTLGRGQFRTVAVEHEAQDRVQDCVYFPSVIPSTIIYNLLTSFTGVPASVINKPAWDLECDTYLDRLYTRLITEPTGVTRLITELIQQAGLALWWDDQVQQLKLLVLHGIVTSAFSYDETNTIAGSIKVSEQLSKRVTEIWTYYGTRNYLLAPDRLDNYRSALGTTDLETATLVGAPSIVKVLGTWIPEFASTTAERVNALQLGRYVTPPRRVSFAVARRSGVQEPVLGGGYKLSYHGNQDEMGNEVPMPIQVTRIAADEDRLEVEAEEMLFKQLFDAANLQDRVITIDGAINNVQLKVVHDSIYPAVTAEDVINGVTLTCVIAGTAIVGSVDTASVGLLVENTWPTGFLITLVVNGRLQGAGGKGGDAQRNPGDPGSPGGTALFTRFPITVENNSEIWGGGGGGGAGTGAVGAAGAYPGGGGAGTVGGAGGVRSDAGSASPGTTDAGGAGLVFGGPGGGPGLAGSSGIGTQNNQLGGAPGSAIDGISFVTLSVIGDIRGPQVN